MTMSSEVYEYIWEAVGPHAEKGLRLVSPKLVSPEPYDRALSALGNADDEDILERAFLSDVLRVGLPNLPPDMPKTQDPESLQALTESGKSRLQAALGKAGLILALPDFYRGNNHGVIVSQEVTLSLRDLHYFRVQGSYGTPAGSETSVSLSYHRLLHAATASGTAPELTYPGDNPERTLIMGPELINEYLDVLAQTDQEAPGSTPRVEWLKAGHSIGLDLSLPLDPGQFRVPAPVTVDRF